MFFTYNKGLLFKWYNDSAQVVEGTRPEQLARFSKQVIEGSIYSTLLTSNGFSSGRITISKGLVGFHQNNGCQIIRLGFLIYDSLGNSNKCLNYQNRPCRNFSAALQIAHARLHQAIASGRWINVVIAERV